MNQIQEASMDISVILLIFTLLAFLGVLIISERIRARSQREWLEPDEPHRNAHH
jgi:hypothetical protein